MIKLDGSFKYERPVNLEQTLSLMSALHAAKTKFILSAGGTDLIPYMKRNQKLPSVLISINSIPELKGVSETSDGRILIGAATTLADIKNHPLIQKKIPALSSTADLVASPQIQNRATLGGNLLVDHRCVYFNQGPQNRGTFGACFKSGGEECHLIPNASREKTPLCRARFVSDLAPVLLTLDAKLHILNSSGKSVTALRDFYLKDGIQTHKLKSTDLVTQIEIDLSARPEAYYEKLRIRNAIDFPSVGVALGFRSPSEWSVAITGINTYPIFMTYHGPALEPILAQMCGDATRQAVPIKQDFFPPGYRKKMISVLIQKCAARFKNTDGT